MKFAACLAIVASAAFLTLRARETVTVQYLWSTPWQSVTLSEDLILPDYYQDLQDLGVKGYEVFLSSNPPSRSAISFQKWQWKIFTDDDFRQRFWPDLYKSRAFGALQKSIEAMCGVYLNQSDWAVSQLVTSFVARTGGLVGYSPTSILSLATQPEGHLVDGVALFVWAVIVDVDEEPPQSLPRTHVARGAIAAGAVGIAGILIMVVCRWLCDTIAQR